MSIVNILDQIHSNGGKLSLDGSNLALDLPAGKKLPSELRELLITNKAQIVSYFELDARMGNLFQRAWKELNRRFAELSPEMRNQFHFPDHIREIEDRLEATWIACREGEQSLEQFTMLLKEWFWLHAHAIERCMNRQGVPEKEEQTKGRAGAA